MIEEYFKPLTLQIDSGFGSTADSLYYAAQALEKNIESPHGFGIGGGKLPILYLYRHSIELYLKAVITFIYRIHPQDSSSKTDDNFPKLKSNGIDKKIFNVHSISILFDNYLLMLENNKDSIHSRSGYNWFDIPEEIPLLIKKIEDYDSSSTMFRCPITMDPNLDYGKSTFKEYDPLKSSKLNEGSKSNIFLLIQNSNSEIIESYVSDNNALDEIYKALKDLSEQLSGLHFGLKLDLIRN